MADDQKQPVEVNPEQPADKQAAALPEKSAVPAPVSQGEPTVLPAPEAQVSPAAPVATISSEPAAAPAEEGKPTEVFHLDGAAESAKPKRSLLSVLLKRDLPAALDAKEKTAPATSSSTLFSSSGGEQPSSPKKIDGTASISQLLGPKPLFDKVAEETERRSKHRHARLFFGTSVALGLLVYGFFFTQLDPDFTLLNSQLGPNTALRFDQTTVETQKIQTDINLVRYRQARLWLDELNLRIDPLIASHRTTQLAGQVESTRRAAADELGTQAQEVKTILLAVQKIFNQPLGVDTFSLEPVLPQDREAQYTALALAELDRQKSSFGGDVKQSSEDVRGIDAVRSLLANRTFRFLIRGQDINALTDEQLVELLKEIRAQGTDALSSIEQIKKQRIDWSSVITSIHDVVRVADRHYGQGLFKTIGGFVFSSYRFDSKTGRISLSGLTRTSDSKTFSFIATLIDSIEKSPQFKDIDFRSFSKSRDQSGDFSAGLNLEFTLQKEPDPRDSLDLPPAN
ncbi:hypothetical protein CO046_03975 [Candidatus Peregrinibacteria bacterium CG_4_9_14_0_2_um_filter_53_11]|nr:MAG: hypothetical protein CO046_03975 [Candidatus Peregrinibacteria bacterium CG_4_9_14_0_2_um_filter_53_11]